MRTSSSWRRWASVPVVNGLSDYNHPCQAMADALTIQERFGRQKRLSVAFVGDGNNVALSLMHVCAKLGWNFTLASPEGYDLDPSAVELAGIAARESGSTLQFQRDPHVAVRDAQVIYTDTWTSMGQEQEAERRSESLRAVSGQRRIGAGGGAEDAMVMHCLPAHRNQELTDEVADGPALGDL